ncbi:MAG TPA: valine--tRNA ligase [Acidimicrobiales bacterium]|nr:valine--tRNA ligase [Acidimicrobiales bacterium]
MPTTVPDKPSLEGLEQKWAAAWENQGTYAFDRTVGRPDVYSIDTPPLTVSGSLHVGHAFSFTHTDTVARYQRMRGKSVFYPMGWDDNGLATERRVQNYFGVRCDPSLPYQPGFDPPARGGLAKDQEAVSVSRPNFVELCHELVGEDEQAFEAVWRRIGLSCDWAQYYTTIDAPSQRASQRGFLRLLAAGQAYSASAPTLWDIDFRTAVAQAELEDRERDGAYHKLIFRRADGSPLLIDTTRPELLAACVAVVAHPDDERYSALVGTTVTTPVFEVPVPFMAHPLAQVDKGTGVAMICTFGDTTDVTWWRELSLPVRAIIGRDGRLLASAPDGLSAAARSLYEERLAGRTVRQAQTEMVKLLSESGTIEGDPRPIKHPVKFYEKGDRPLEIVTSRQWFFKTIEHRDALLARGRELAWYPHYMSTRFTHWVEGLAGDWLISRQRFFGVPFPVWYRLSESGELDYDNPLLPEESSLPVDPSTDVPSGYEEAQRGQPGGFVGDPDVMDTWATSSLTPQIAGRWEDDPELFERIFPMDLRPQAHDIIRTWLFATIVRSHLEFDSLPWANAAISGWILDPDRKKMSKSKGNVVTPMDLLEKYGSDAVRYWAASARPGTDTAFDEGQMKIGRKLAIKLLNASRFVLSASGGASEAPAELEPVDADLLAALSVLVADATAAFDEYDYARALERTEAFFWEFCDDYVELVKNRAYGTLGDDRAASARYALSAALSTLLRLFAPFLPFVTEEVWSWWQEGSVHRAAWPAGGASAVDESAGSRPAGGASAVDESAAGRPAGAASAGPSALSVARLVLAEIRKKKTESGVSLRAPVARVVVSGPESLLGLLATAGDDVRQAGGVAEAGTLVLDPAGAGAREGQVVKDIELAPADRPDPRPQGRIVGDRTS